MVEDADVTFNGLLEASIDADVVAAMDCLTKRKGKKPDDYYNRVAKNGIAIEVKFADMRHNSDATRFPPGAEQRGKLRTSAAGLRQGIF
ncbi:MAG: hypothetical protein LBP26_04495 [Clostridiales bacterium]|nr:hypothetical protein [Clostridiales bacterium]